MSVVNSDGSSVGSPDRPNRDRPPTLGKASRALRLVRGIVWSPDIVAWFPPLWILITLLVAALGLAGSGDEAMPPPIRAEVGLT